MGVLDKGEEKVTRPTKKKKEDCKDPALWVLYHGSRRICRVKARNFNVWSKIKTERGEES